MIRLHGALGQRLPVRRRTRQGDYAAHGSSTYSTGVGDPIDTISKSDSGLSPRGETYSVFCYADDPIIASTTSTEYTLCGFLAHHCNRFACCKYHRGRQAKVGPGGKVGHPHHSKYGECYGTNDDASF